MATITMFFRDLAEFRFLQHALVAILLVSLPAGLMGSWVVVRRNTYVAGAISHCILGGIGLAVYLRGAHGVTWLTPALGASLAAVGAAVLVGWVTLSGRLRTDSVLSAVWAVGMALGVSFMAMTPGYHADLMSYLFGNILMVGESGLWTMAVLNVVVAVPMVLCHNRLLAIGFNAEMAYLHGVSVKFYELLFMVLTALTIVIMVQVVGIVLALALLTLPAATAGLIARSFKAMIALAVGLVFASSLGGLVISYAHDLPTGATIVELAALVYVIAAVSVRLVRRRWLRGNS